MASEHVMQSLHAWLGGPRTHARPHAPLALRGRQQDGRGDASDGGIPDLLLLESVRFPQRDSRICMICIKFGPSPRHHTLTLSRVRKGRGGLYSGMPERGGRKWEGNGRASVAPAGAPLGMGPVGGVPGPLGLSEWQLLLCRLVSLRGA